MIAQLDRQQNRITTERRLMNVIIEAAKCVYVYLIYLIEWTAAAEPIRNNSLKIYDIW